jgi:hypothetical protein
VVVDHSRTELDRIWSSTILAGVDVPAFVTHYYVPGRPPFLSLSELSDAEASPVLDELAAASRRGGSSRRFGPRYLTLRRATERKLRRMFRERGGQPVREYPHYFVLRERLTGQTGVAVHGRLSAAARCEDL